MRLVARLLLLPLLPSTGCGKQAPPPEARSVADIAPAPISVKEDAASAASADDDAMTTGSSSDASANRPPVAPEVAVVAEDATVPPLASELAERIRARKPGCIAFGVDGRTVLYVDEGIRESGSGRETWLYYVHTDRLAELQKRDEWPLTDPPDRDVEDGIRQRLAGQELVACQTITAPQLDIPSAPPVRVGKHGSTLEVEVKGQTTRTLSAKDDWMGDLQVVEGYWATGIASVFLRLAPSDQPEYLNQLVVRIDPARPEVEKLW